MPTPLPPFPKMLMLAFDQPTLGFLMKALDRYSVRLERRGLRKRPVSRAERLPLRALIVSLAEDGPREFTRAETQMMRQACRWYVGQRPELLTQLDAFL